MKKAGVLVGGLLVAFIGQFLALGLAGGGHGWNTPFFVSLVLWIAYPIVLFRALRSPEMRTMPAERAMLFTALVGNVVLVLATLEEGLEYFLKITQVEGALNATLWIGAWVLIWLGWQVVALMNFIRAKARQTA